MLEFVHCCQWGGASALARPKEVTLWWVRGGQRELVAELIWVRVPPRCGPPHHLGGSGRGDRTLHSHAFGCEAGVYRGEAGFSRSLAGRRDNQREPADP